MDSGQILVYRDESSCMDSNGHHPHVVRFASPVFTIADISNPSWSSVQSIESMDHRGGAGGHGTQDESGETTRSDPLIISIALRAHPRLFGPVEPLDFGLGFTPSRQESGRFVSDVDGSEPLNFGLSSPHVDQEDERVILHVHSEYNFGLPLNDKKADGMYDRGILPPSSDIHIFGTGLLDFGIAQSSTAIGNDPPTVTPTRTSRESVKSSFAKRHYGHTGRSEQMHMPPVHLARSVSLTPSQYCTSPPWASVPSSFPAIDQFNREYRNDEMRVSDPDGNHPDDLISATTPPHTGSRPSLPHRRLLPDNPLHAATSGLEDPHTPLSDKELLKLCQSMTLGVLNEDEYNYARRLLSEVADGDNERDIAPPTLQDIVEAERPLHVAYLQATATFRKRVQDLQRAVRLHTRKQQLRDQVQAMLDSAEKREHLF
ncbi:hypothetical protein BDR05DRAFT_999721 [Suillus weaverae]|nr:hypothetical protein BDR05DRAFT_999721 [Suillus weaverae]